MGYGGEGARPGVCACGLPAGVRVPRVGALRPGGVAVDGGCAGRLAGVSEEQQLWACWGRGARPNACVCGLPAGVRVHCRAAEGRHFAGSLPPRPLLIENLLCI